jgi:hypothetical protein
VRQLWRYVAFPVPEALTQGKTTVRVRFEAKKSATAGPVFGLRLHAVDT